jgi:hypothetical protein
VVRVVFGTPHRNSTRIWHGAPTVDIGKRTRKNNHNVYILGAGFSSEAGLPTIPNFLNSMRDAADWLASEHRDQERNAVERVLEFRHKASAAGYRVNVDLDNVEDLFSLATALPDRHLAQDMQTAIAATLKHAQVHASPPSVRLRMSPSESWPITAALELIRFGGHLLKGGYDVHNGRNDKSAATPALH